MEKFRGILQIRYCNPGSRSEGNMAYLVIGEGEELMLCREGGVPINDPFYEPYADMEVEIVGELSHGLLVVESINRLEQPEQEV